MKLRKWTHLSTFAELRDHDHVVECIAWAPESAREAIREAVADPSSAASTNNTTTTTNNHTGNSTTTLKEKCTRFSFNVRKTDKMTGMKWNMMRYVDQKIDRSQVLIFTILMNKFSLKSSTFPEKLSKKSRFFSTLREEIQKTIKIPANTLPFSG